MAEGRADEQGSLIQVLENANWEHVRRMFPYQAGTGGLGRILRCQASSGANPSAEVRLKTVADEQRYDNIVCGLLSFRSEFHGKFATPLLVGSAATTHFPCFTRWGTQDVLIHKS